MKTILFDCDGVIIDDEYIFLMDIKRMLKEYYNIEKDIKDLVDYAGCNTRRFLEVSTSLLQSEEEAEAFRLKRRAYYDQNPMDYKSLVKADALSLLKYLKENGYRIALVTSGSETHTHNKLKVCGIHHYFDYILTGSEVKKTKPDPEIYLKAVDTLKLSKDDCIVIEDSEIGVEAAHRAGLKVIANQDSRIPSDLSLADYIVDDLMKVINYLS